MTAMRTITVTLPEHIVAAAEADVAAGDAASLDAWIAGELMIQRINPTVIQLARERYEAIDAGCERLLTIDEVATFLDERKASLGRS
jgi:hypothetical protein